MTDFLAITRFIHRILGVFWRLIENRRKIQVPLTVVFAKNELKLPL